MSVETQPESAPSGAGPDGDKHGPHRIYRCNISGCENVMTYADIKNGGCPFCGSRRFTWAVAISDKEAEYLRLKCGYSTEEHGWRHEESPRG